MHDSILLYCTRHSVVKRITRESDYVWNCMTSLDTSSSLSKRYSAIDYMHYQNI